MRSYVHEPLGSARERPGKKQHIRTLLNIVQSQIRFTVLCRCPVRHGRPRSSHESSGGVQSTASCHSTSRPFGVEPGSCCAQHTHELISHEAKLSQSNGPPVAQHANTIIPSIHDPISSQHRRMGASSKPPNRQNRRHPSQEAQETGTNAHLAPTRPSPDPVCRSTWAVDLQNFLPVIHYFPQKYRYRGILGLGGCRQGSPGPVSPQGTTLARGSSQHARFRRKGTQRAVRLPRPCMMPSCTLLPRRYPDALIPPPPSIIATLRPEPLGGASSRADQDRWMVR